MGNNWVRIYNNFNVATYVSSGVVIPVFVALLYQNYMGANYGYINHISWLIIASNGGSLMQQLCYSYWDRNWPEAEFIYYIFDAIGVFLVFAGSALAHWYFNHKYFKIAGVLQYYQAKQPVPANRKTIDSWTNYIFVTLNLLAAAGAGITRFLWLNQIYCCGGANSSI